MPYELKVEKTLRGWRDLTVGYIFIGLVVGAVIGVLLSLFSIYEMGLSGLLGTLVLGLSCAGIAALVGALLGLTYWIPEKVKVAISAGFIILVLIAMVWGVILPMQRAGTLPEYLKFASPLFEAVQKGLKEVAEFRHCLYADPRCPFFVPFDDPNIQSRKEELSVDVAFDEKKIKADNTVSLLVKLSVSNPKLAELRIKPKCYFKTKDKNKGGRELTVERLGTYAYGDEFRFPSTGEGEELNTQFYCYGDILEGADKNVFSEKVIIELERPVAVKTTWPVWIGKKPRKGIVRSEMAFNAPYIVSLASNNDMPFEEGKDYGFQVTIKRRADDVKLKRIESIIISFPEEIMAECEHFEGLEEIEIREASYDALKEITQYNAEQDKFVFPCTLYVSAAPVEAVMAPVLLESYYSVYSDHSTRIFKSP